MSKDDKCFKALFQAPFGMLVLKSDENELESVDFIEPEALKSFDAKDTCALLKEAIKQLDLYFQARLKKFNLPLKEQGSKFEQKVYKALQDIEYGSTATYKELAKNIGHEKAFRAVGNANAKNKLPIFIPCHRVLASKGLGGYSFGDLEVKRYLLKLEGVLGF